MKKLILVGAIALFGAVNAQSFGVKAGMNIATLSNVPGGSTSQIGFNAGAFMNAAIASNFSIQPELLYSTKGAKVTGANYDLGYISVPIMIQYNIMPNFYLEAGPEFGFIMSAKVKQNSVTTDIKDNVNSFDMGAAIGAGYYFTKNIGANIRYVAGFTDVVKSNTGDSVKNGVFQVGLSYKFAK